MGYSERTDLDQRWGTDNVTLWATLAPLTDTATTVASRVSYAITIADAIIDAYMRPSECILPIVDTSSTTPTLIKHISATLAGHYLYTGHGVQDYNPETGQGGSRLAAHYADAIQMLKEIRDGKTLQLALK